MPDPGRSAAGGGDALIASLLRPEAYDHPVEHLQLLQTHISWIVLTGRYAYKIKKPVNLGFVDFSTLARRRHFCQEELRLNRRLAPELYLDVVRIHGPPAQASFRGDGPVIEVAVRMHQFRQQDLLPAVLSRGSAEPRLPAWIEELADRLACFHAAAERATPEDGHSLAEALTDSCAEGFVGSCAARVRQPAEANLSVLERLLGDDPRLPPLRHWCEQEGQRLAALFDQRLSLGQVRECHGDLHLGNLVLHGGRIAVFDCLEFSASLRWIDVISDIAFLAMDLCRFRQPQLAASLLNRWLEHSGDYGGLRLWRWYVAYRALVRAKVSALRLQAPGESSAAERRRWRADLRAYLCLADAATRPPQPLLLITHGLSGSGKSHWAARLARRQAWLHLRSDLERLRLFGRWGEAAGEILSGDAYRPEVSARLYGEHLLSCCDAVLEAGLSLVCDATFLRRDQRRLYRDLAARRGARFAILACSCSPELARRRISERQIQGVDPSEADLEVFERQRSLIEPLDGEELACSVAITASALAPGAPPADSGVQPMASDSAEPQLEALILALNRLGGG